ncbi:MAG: hypothetical protein Q4D26_05615 [Clostridia bacterium]|nr:hypothetical protein [Clostridia bacterium]
MFDKSTNAIAVKINHTYRADMTDSELYDTARTAWEIDKEKRSILKYALAVYNGEIIDVFEVAAWLDAGTTLNTVNTEDKIVNAEKRSEFVGKFAEDEIRNKYKGKALTEFINTTYGEFVYMNVSKD